MLNILKLSPRPIGCLVIAALFLSMAGIASARENSDNDQRREGPPSPEERLQRMQQNLDLNDAQSSQVKSILQQEYAKHETAHKEAEQAMTKVLTKEQIQKMQNHPPRQQQGSNGGDNRSGMSGRRDNQSGNSSNRREGGPGRDENRSYQ